jgi:hypothetical protein
MRFRVKIGLALSILSAVLFIAGCQGPPPTVYVLVVTATPEIPTAEVSPGAIVVQNATAVTTTPTVTTTPAFTPTPSLFPTVTASQIQVAEQRFENGRMFWLQPTNQIWVMTHEPDDPTNGQWTVYDDTFVEGQQEFDPRIVPPEGLLQPERGFGKLWRQNPEIKDALGWALETEFGHVTRYEYHPAGTVENQTYVKAPGYHILFSLWGESYRFNEADGTWQLDQ